MAHWGDLTPLWYYQHVEGHRRDLMGLFPPTLELARAWLETGHAVYLSGPLLGWSQGLGQRYRIVSWGFFAKILLPGIEPSLPGETPRWVLFGDKMVLVGQYLDPVPSSFGAVRLGLHWRVLTSIPAEGYLISLRLVDEAGQRVAQRDDLLVSRQYPWPNLPPGDDLFWVGHLPLPDRLLSGQYRLQVVVYHALAGELALKGEGALGTILDVGAVQLR